MEGYIEVSKYRLALIDARRTYPIVFECDTHEELKQYAKDKSLTFVPFVEGNEFLGAYVDESTGIGYIQVNQYGGI